MFDVLFCWCNSSNGINTNIRYITKASTPNAATTTTTTKIAPKPASASSGITPGVTTHYNNP